MTRCPTCGSWRLHRSHMKWWERPVRLVSTSRPYTCFECHWRGWFPRDAVARSQATVVTPLPRRTADPNLAQVDERLAETTPETPPRSLV